MTTFLEAVQAMIEEGFKITTVITLLLLWRKHQSSKRMRSDIEAIKRAVLVSDADLRIGNVEQQNITGHKMKSLSQLEAYAIATIARYFTRSTETYRYQQRRMKMKSKLLSRKFLMALVAGILIIANDGLELNLDTSTITAFCSIVVGYIAGEAATDIAKVRANKNDVNPGDTGPAE